MNSRDAESLLPQRGNRFSIFVGRVVLRLMGWQILGDLPSFAKVVAIAAPHTSNWDFMIGMAVVLRLRLHVTWLGKHTLFRPPFGWLFRFLGGLPVDRGSAAGIVGQCTRLFEAREKMILGLSPEGTRKRVEKWKTGFYYIALEAQVPIVLVAFDYSKRQVVLGPLLQPSGEFERDMAVVRNFYNHAMAKYPQMFAMP